MARTKYRYVQHIRYEHDLINIDDGPFKDVQYVYGSVKFLEEEGQLRIKYDYTVIHNPKGCDTESEEFKKLTNDILHENIQLEMK
jgi:hypothetical protein|tara:strand:+ start:159 stop:413 length:255 start_codon:yes stop_codon:yes gene_type:complete